MNGLNTSVKRHRKPAYIEKQDLTIYCLQETHFNYKDTDRLKIKTWRKMYHSNTKQKKAGVNILIPHKV